MNRLGAERRPFLFVIDYKQEQVIVEEPDQIDSEALLYNLDGVTNVATASRMNDRENRTSAIRWETFPITQSAYADSFHKVVGHIRAGNSYLVNLTCATPVRTDLSLKDVFVSSEARYKLWMKDCFVVFSPEIFVKIRDEHIYSYPMKGTIDATLPDARRRILEDPKETAEHATIVDLIRNDLSMVATEVMVTRYRYIDELPTHQGALLQVSSEIRGRLAGGWQAEVGDLFFRLLPAGSITGAPKKKTMEIIAEAETYERGFYTGVMGYFDGNSLDSAVMIRFLEQQADGSLIFPRDLVLPLGNGMQITSRTISGRANSVVSTARCIPRSPQRRNKSSNGPGCNNGSPPQNVTPPSERSMKTISFSISFIKASAEYSVPDISIAIAGHTSAQIPHRVQRAPSVTIPSGVSVNACSGQASTHVRQPMHFFFV